MDGADTIKATLPRARLERATSQADAGPRLAASDRGGERSVHSLHTLWFRLVLVNPALSDASLRSVPFGILTMVVAVEVIF